MRAARGAGPRAEAAGAAADAERVAAATAALTKTAATTTAVLLVGAGLVRGGSLSTSTEGRSS